MGLFGPSRPTALKLGFFGKLPTYGDFVSLNAAGVETEAFVRWLQDGATALPPGGTPAAEQTVEFVWLWPGSRKSLVGIFRPSTDAAGRRFPIALFTAVPAPFLMQLGALRLLAAEPVWQRLHELMGRVAAETRIESQFAVLRDAALPFVPEPKDVEEAWAERAKSPSLAAIEASRIGLQVHEVQRLAEALRAARIGSNLAVRLRLHGAIDVHGEAVGWTRMLEERLDVADLEASAFVRVRKQDRAAALFLFSRDVDPADLGFILAPSTSYRAAGHVGFGEVVTGPEEAAIGDAFARAWAVREPSPHALIELGDREWTAEEPRAPVARPPVARAPVAPAPMAPPSRPAAAAQAVLPASSRDDATTSEIAAAAIAAATAAAAAGVPPAATPADERHPAAPFVEDPEPVTDSASEGVAHADATEPVREEEASARADDPSFDTHSSDAAAAEAPSSNSHSSNPASPEAAPPVATGDPPSAGGETTDQVTGTDLSHATAAALAGRVRDLAAAGMLPGHVVKFAGVRPGPFATASPFINPSAELVVYVDEQAAQAVALAPQQVQVMQVQRRIQNHVEARRLLAELAKVHRAVEAELAEAVEEACARSRAVRS